MFGEAASFDLADMTAERWSAAPRPAFLVAETAPSGKPPPLGLSPAQIRAEFLAASRREAPV